VHEFLPGGITLKRPSARFETAAEGVDLISVTAGKSPETKEWSIQPMAFPRGASQPSVNREASVRTPILVAGRINDPVLANEILKREKPTLSAWAEV